jgi:hypothetical protein
MVNIGGALSRRSNRFVVALVDSSPSTVARFTEIGGSMTKLFSSTTCSGDVLTPTRQMFVRSQAASETDDLSVLFPAFD